MRFSFLGLTFFIFGLWSSLASSQQETIDKQVAINSAAAKSQEKINKLDDQTAEDFQKYRAAIARSESLSIYNKQLKRLIESQVEEISSIKRQTNQIESIEIGALPFMLEMTATLEQLVNADVPFLRDERLTRIEQLKALIDRADVSAGEKYRRIMEAYLVEAEYGRTIEAYRGELSQSDQVITVDFLRFGRIGLFYQTLDGKKTGRWNASLGQWETLKPKYRSSIRDGLRIARKQAPPALLSLPFNAPEAS